MTRLKSKEFIIRSKLLIWYKKNKRKLPWRKLLKNNLPNPYYIMISEYMLQQTTVGTVKIRFNNFISKWPNINALSRISENTILSFWITQLDCEKRLLSKTILMPLMTSPQDTETW